MAEETRKEDRRVRRTKKLLTQALTQLMQQKQVKEITVKELTDLADMNRGTFYLYYKDIFDMLEKIEDGIFEALNSIVEQHEHEDVAHETKPLLLELFTFLQDNREMVRVLLSPHGDMSFLYRLFQVIREKCVTAFPEYSRTLSEADFDYHFSFVVFGVAGLIRAWVNRECAESALQMAELADVMLRRGSLSELQGENGIPS